MACGSMNSGDDATKAEINVTPLVDVMVVLLIVFMITMPVLTHSIPLELPTAAEQAAKKEKQPTDPLRLTIGADGSYYFGAESASKVSIEEVAEKLKTAKAEKEDLIVAIAADKSVEYDYVNKALEAAREAGTSKIGFFTEPKSVAKQSISNAFVSQTARPPEKRNSDGPSGISD